MRLARHGTGGGRIKYRQIVHVFCFCCFQWVADLLTATCPVAECGFECPEARNLMSRHSVELMS